jgi:hypothetical protein
MEITSIRGRVRRKERDRRLAKHVGFENKDVLIVFSVS